MLNRRVKPFFNPEGIVVRWEPLSSGMCDALVRYDDGTECWHASHTLTPVDGLGPLPSRQEYRKHADEVALDQLRDIRANLIREWRKPWPGCDFGKVSVGRGLDAAIKDVSQRWAETKV